MGRVALVTGASSGIGRVMALSLLEAGHRVVLSATDAGALEAVRLASRAADRAAVVRADLSKETDVDLLARAAEEPFGPIDILINNAGVPGGPMRPAQDVDLREMRRVLEINTFAAIHLAQRLVPAMIRRGWGRVIYVGTSHDTMLRFVPYGMSKAAGEAFMAALSTSLERTGVTANVLLPGGMTATRMTERGGDPGAMLQPQIMGPPILWLASDASDRVSGRRFVAARWNPSLKNGQAAQAAGSPIGWSGDRAIRPGEL